MEIVCENCKKKLNIPDEKVPKDRVAYLKCPGCKEKIAVGGPTKPEPPQDEGPTTFGELTSSSYDASEKPFDFLEEEAKTSVVCIPEQGLKDHISQLLESIEYHNTTADNARDALKKMRYHTFHLVVLDELFDCKNLNANGVLIFLQHLPMAIRRNIFVVLISENHRTMDNMQAFNKSVNLIINRKNLNEFEKILLKGIADQDIFYRVYHVTAKKVFSV